jgi:uncharacterized protein YxeA
MFIETPKLHLKMGISISIDGFVVESDIVCMDFEIHDFEFHVFKLIFNLKMILVNRLYTVFSVILIVLVTTFYLLYVSKGENKEYLLYLQSNSSYALQTTSTIYKPFYPYDSTTSSYNTNFNNSRVYMDAFEGSSNSGRFIAIFSNSPSNISFQVVTDSDTTIASYNSTLPSAYYPLYINFISPKDTKWIELRYSTTQNSNTLYKLSVEFF